jgi:hexosaminidase
MRLAACIVLFLFSAVLHAQYDPQRYPVIPKPQTLLALSSGFKLDNSVTIVTEQRSARSETEFFRSQLKTLHNIDLKYGKLAGFEPCIWISLDSFGLPPEGYELYITKEGINLYGSRAGIFYGLQTILQLVQSGTEQGSLLIPSCSIIDYPRFAWRGMHLDVARHFFPKENVKQYLRYMAMYKLNTFHWHLTDDQGWRIEIKKFPLLTAVGGWRKATLIGHFSEEPDRYDSTRYGGFYTQEEIREVVRYADSLHITVVPEIEMPGHARALLAAYPEFGIDRERKTEVACTWGVFEEVIMPGETSLNAMYGILDEVCALFPSEYIHIGGDECPKDEWKRSAQCQALIKTYDLKDENGLQSWFVQRIVTHLSKRGKKAIGWDEILEGGLADGAAVMSWRGEEGGIAAAKAHHNVVMTPGSHCYFNYYQSENISEPLAIGGYLPLDKVYSYDPVPASLSDSGKKYIIGVQANLWTEYISSFSQAEYMLFPRIAALAEVAWSRKDIKSYDSFLRRTIAHMGTYEKMRVNFSRAIYDIEATYAAAPGTEGVLLSLKTIAPYGEIRYSYDNSVTLGDSLYTEPVLINATHAVRATVFYGEERMGRDFIQRYTFHAAMGKQVTLRKQPSASYNHGGALTLVDGITGRTPWTGSEWLGWWGDTLDAVIDLGRLDTLHSIKVVMLDDAGSWIYPSENISVLTSNDGVHYTAPVAEEIFTRPAAGVQQVEIPLTSAARYVQIRITGKGIIPEGASGAGYPAWLFVSEIIVE